jgi:outer membrane protein
MRQRIVWLLAGLVALTPVLAQVEPSRSFNLESAVSWAQAHNPAGLAAGYEVEGAARDVQRALYRKYLPDLDFSLYSGLVPGARGDIFYSPDKQTDLDQLGIFYRFSLSLIQPLYTFGQATAGVEAARRLRDAAESEREVVLETLALEVVKAYWGLSAAMKAETLAGQSSESYDQLLAEIQKRLGKEDSEVDDLDLLEAKSYQIDIEEIKQESLTKRALAERTFADEPAPELLSGPDLPAGLILLVEKSHPEIRGGESGVQALEARVRLAKSRSLPILFLGAGFSFAHAGNRQDQTNPFAVDGFNYRNIDAVLGLRWDPDIFLHRIEVARAESDARAAEEKLKLLRAGVELGLRQAFLEARKNDALLRAARRSLGAAKTWLRVSMDNWELGLGDSFRLLRAYQSYYRLRGAEIEREYQFNLSLAKLAYATGSMKTYLAWVKAGKAALE